MCAGTGEVGATTPFTSGALRAEESAAAPRAEQAAQASAHRPLRPLEGGGETRFWKRSETLAKAGAPRAGQRPPALLLPADSSAHRSAAELPMDDARCIMRR